MSLEDFAKRFQGLNLEPAALREIFNFLPYPLLLARLENGVRRNIFVNEKFIEEIGYTIPEIPTITDWFETAYPDAQYREEIRTEWEYRVALSKDKNTITLPAIIKTKAFGYQWYEVTANPSGDIDVVAFVNIQSAKTSEKKLQEENHNRDRILSILGHDLRGPIINLLSLTRLFQGNQLSQEELKLVMRGVQSDANHSLDLLDTLLTWTRSNFNKINVKYGVVDLKRLAFKTIELYQHALRSKQIEAEVHMAADTPFYSDEVILEIVMRNLVSNAIKFSSKGKIKITSFGSNEKISFMVSDCGQGMSADHIHFITTNQPFSKEGTHREKGFGLGLRLCREFLPMIGGSLEIRSKENEGTSVIVTCPLLLDKPAV